MPGDGKVKAIRHSRIGDVAIHRTTDKLPIYIKYVEQEFDIIILEGEQERKVAEKLRSPLWL